MAVARVAAIGDHASTVPAMARVLVSALVSAPVFLMPIPSPHCLDSVTRSLGTSRLGAGTIFP